MKKIGIVVITVLLSLSATAQHYYYYHGNKIYFNQNEYIRNICIDTDTPYQQRKVLLDSLNKYSTSIDTFSNFSYRCYIDSLKLPLFLSAIALNASLIKLNSPELTINHSIFWADRKILSKIKYDVPIKPILDSIGVPYISYEREEYDVLRYTISLNVDSAVFYAQKLYESGLFVFATSDFYSLVEVNSVEDNPYYANQWSVLNDSVNINVLPAWDITSGKNIRVAVIDVGVQLEHEDLVDNLEMGYDAVHDEFVELFAENGAPESILDNHGTCCSGIIAAENNDVGCVGVAYRSHIIPIRAAHTYLTYRGLPDPPEPTIVKNFVFKNEWFIDALNHACYEKKADIISLSMEKTEPFEPIETKISEICSMGRNGKGLVLVASAGNTYSDSYGTADTLEYIAKHSDVISVGSIAPCGERVKYDNTCSFPSIYNSCYGDSLDLVAPGLLIPTTAYCDEFVYNAYTTSFAGTSAAAPHVAGVAALILSVNPCLTREEVTYILESTCTKVRPDLYSYGNNPNHPNGTWNIEVGHGLVNAYEAVLLAQQMGGYVFRGQDTISSNTLWDTASLINADLIIDSLVTLTITDTLYVAAGSRIIVRPGGKLIVNGGTLTNACDGEMWQGIIVEGNANIRQAALAQGSVILNNATIENARDAICTRKADSDPYIEHAGGIIQATNTLFRNNRRSVEFLRYENHTTGGAVTDNVSYFTRCTFTVDSNNLFAANDVTFKNHVTMWHVRGVKFNGCTFRNETATHDGKAIYTEKAGFIARRVCPLPTIEPCVCNNYGTDTVRRCLFVGFDTAVHATNTEGSYLVTLDNCDFANNYIGVELAAADNARVSFCDFDMVHTVNGNVGLDMKNSTGYTVEGNSFHRTNTSTLTSIGICVDNSGTAENVMRLNEFTKIKYGCYAWNCNAETRTRPSPGLQYTCNDYDSCRYGIFVGNAANIRSIQGSASVGADNSFYNNIGSGKSISIPANHSNVKYYYYDSGSHAPVGSSNYTPLQSTNANSCASSLCGDIPLYPRGTAALSQYQAMAEEYAALVEMLRDVETCHGASLQTDAPDPQDETDNAALIGRLSDLSAQMGDLSRAGIRNILNDSVPDMGMLKQWYATIVETLRATSLPMADSTIPVSAYQLAEVYSMEGDLAAAATLLSSLPQQFTPDEASRSEFANYMALQQLRETVAGNWYTMTDTDIAAMRQVAEYDNGRAARMAKEILCFFHHICYEDEPLWDMDGIGERALRGDGACPIATTDDGTLRLHPNPTTHTLTVETTSPIRTLTVYDLAGRVMMTVDGGMVETCHGASLQVDVSSLPNGIYLLRAITDNGVETGRFVKTAR